MVLILFRMRDRERLISWRGGGGEEETHQLEGWGWGWGRLISWRVGGGLERDSSTGGVGLGEGETYQLEGWEWGEGESQQLEGWGWGMGATTAPPPPKVLFQSSCRLLTCLLRLFTTKWDEITPRSTISKYGLQGLPMNDPFTVVLVGRGWKR